VPERSTPAAVAADLTSAVVRRLAPGTDSIESVIGKPTVVEFVAAFRNPYAKRSHAPAAALIVLFITSER
jgi:hypothetical protein